jgi:hypothetical protein
MLANPTREVRIDQFTDFAHDFHPQEPVTRRACFLPPIPFGLSPKEPAHPWEKPRSAIIRNLNAAARLALQLLDG